MACIRMLCVTQRKMQGSTLMEKKYIQRTTMFLCRFQRFLFSFLLFFDRAEFGDDRTGGGRT